jgi:hypothetical protein
MSLLLPPISDTPKTEPKEWVASRLYLASLYFITVGVLYLWGYWQTFGINILEYLDLADIIKVTAYPVAVVVIITAASSFGGGQLGSWQSSKLDARLNSAHAHAVLTGSPTELDRFRKFLNRYIKFIISCYIAAVLFSLYLLAINSVYAWSILPTLVALPIAKQLAKNGFLQDRIENDMIRFLLRFAFAAIPLFSYASGKIASENIVQGIAYRFVVSEFPGDSSNKAEHRLRYVGHASDYTFFYDPIREATVIAKIEDDKPLALKKIARRIELLDADNIMDTLRSFGRFLQNQ